MKRKPRTIYTNAQKAVMWDRWQKGESLHSIAHLFDRTHQSVRRILAETGGIRPPPRKRSRLSLTLSEREEISRSLSLTYHQKAATGQLRSKWPFQRLIPLWNV